MLKPYRCRKHKHTPSTVATWSAVMFSLFFHPPSCQCVKWRCMLLLQVRLNFERMLAFFFSRQINMPKIDPGGFLCLWCLDQEPAEKPTLTAAPPAPPTESMSLNSSTMTLVGERLCWSDALLYCRRNNSDLLSLHSEEEQKRVAQMLSRATFAITDGVWLGLRRYTTPNQSLINPLKMPKNTSHQPPL